MYRHITYVYMCPIVCCLQIPSYPILVSSWPFLSDNPPPFSNRPPRCRPEIFLSLCLKIIPHGSNNEIPSLG